MKQSVSLEVSINIENMRSDKILAKSVSHQVVYKEALKVRKARRFRISYEQSQEKSRRENREKGNKR